MQKQKKSFILKKMSFFSVVLHSCFCLLCVANPAPKQTSEQTPTDLCSGVQEPPAVRLEETPAEVRSHLSSNSHRAGILQRRAGLLQVSQRFVKRDSYRQLSQFREWMYLCVKQLQPNPIPAGPCFLKDLKHLNAPFWSCCEKMRCYFELWHFEDALMCTALWKIH